jgi:hypothetical protein
MAWLQLEKRTKIYCYSTWQSPASRPELSAVTTLGDDRTPIIHCVA